MTGGDYGWLIVGGCLGSVGGYYFAMARVHLGAGWRAMKRRR